MLRDNPAIYILNRKSVRYHKKTISSPDSFFFLNPGMFLHCLKNVISLKLRSQMVLQIYN